MLRVLKLIKTPPSLNLFLPINSPIKHKNAFFFLSHFSTQLTKNLQSEPCLAYAFNLIRSSPTRPNSITISSLHCLSIKLGALADIHTSTSLLIFYARTGNLGSSWELFEEIPERDVISWNAMISGCVHNQHFQFALQLFEEIIMEGGSGFDSTTLLIILSAVSRMNNGWKQGQIIHCLSLKLGMDSDYFLCNALIDMYSKRGDLSSSESMFEGTECRDPSTWNSMISGCLYNGFAEKSLWYFREMVLSDSVRVDNLSLSCTISACSRLEELYYGQAIQGFGIKLGYVETDHISVGNALISLYSQCGYIELAETVFRGMICKDDIVSWNSMIHGFADIGMILEAFSLLHEMQIKWNVQPDLVTFLTILPLCAELNLLREGKTIHGFIVRREMGLDLSVTNSLMNVYSKCNSVKSVELLFKAIPERDLISWNTLIAGYSLNECSKEAQTLFKELLCSGPRCSVSTLLAVLSSCDSPMEHQFGKSVHCWLVKLGFSNNVLAVNALMFMYINCGDWVASFSLLQSISAVADVVSWNTVIVGCVQNDHLWQALEAFNQMRCHPHINLDSITLVSILSACGNLELQSKGRFLHGIALKTPMGSDIRVRNALITMYSRCKDIESAVSVFTSNPYRNLCSWNCIISGFAQNKDGTRALELFHCLEFEPNEITIVSILSASTQLGALRHGRQIHGHVFRFGLQWNSFILAALVDMYSKCGRLDIAIQIFQDSPTKSVASWNSMISAYGFHGFGQKAIELFSEMCESGSRATKSTFVSLLSACSHSGLIKEGCWYYDHMSAFGVVPTTEHHVCIVDMLGRSGRLGEACKFIKQIPNQPATGVWGALLSACKHHGDVKMGKQVAEHIFNTDPENVGYYVTLYNIYATAGMWSDAVEIRGMIRDRMLKKPAGYSLIDICSG